MHNVIDQQTFIISVNFNTLTGAVPSIVSLPMNLRFAADELIIKTLAYNALDGTNDRNDLIQIWCNITIDNLIGVFPNAGANVIPLLHYKNEHFPLSNSFQTGNFVLQFQCTDGSLTNGPPITYGNPASYNPQRLISSQTPQRTFGTLSLVIEFIKHGK